MNKNILILILLFLFISKALFSQIEYRGFERNFYSYRFNLIEQSDFSVYNDTTLFGFHNFLYTQKKSYNNLGYQNQGSPVLSACYIDNLNNLPFWFLNNYYPFLKIHEDIIYFDTKKPYTCFTFNGGSKKMDNTGFFHTQNLGSCFNFAFKIDISNSEGQYLYNKTKLRSVSFNTGFTKRRYQSHFNIILNKIDHDENGGLENDNFENSSIANANLSTKLSGANNKVSQFGGAYNHEIKFGQYKKDTLIDNNDTLIGKILYSKFSLLHDIVLDKFHRIYTDNSSDFYENYYFNPKETKDSSALIYMKNKLLLNLDIKSNKTINKFQILAGLSNIDYKYCNSFLDTIKNTIKTNYYKNSTYLTGIILLETNKNKFFTELNYCLFGWQILDFNIITNYELKINNNINLKAYFKYELKTPDLFLNYYTSNNFIWENGNLSKINSTNAGLKVNFNKIFLDLSSNFILLHNYIIFNYAGVPQQISNPNLIADFRVGKLFNIGKFHWYNQAIYQQISNSRQIPFPQLLGYTNLYYERGLFKQVLLLQIGLDCKFNTSIFGYAYMPSTAAFYLQNDKKIGNYPNLGAYFSAKIKRFRGFVKASNINGFFMKRNYYLLYQIPDNPFGVNFGISWEFYD